jgi:hypothetical protein
MQFCLDLCPYYEAKRNIKTIYLSLLCQKAHQFAEGDCLIIRILHLSIQIKDYYMLIVLIYIT